MVKVSYEQKPFRREVMRTYGASVTPSPSMETNVGRKILAEFPGTTGSLGCSISEAVEVAVSNPGYRYVLGSVLNQVLLHQSVIGLETKAAIDEAKKCKETGEEKTIVFGLTGTGYFDMVAYEKFHEGKMSDYIPTDEELRSSIDKLPKMD